MKIGNKPKETIMKEIRNTMGKNSNESLMIRESLDIQGDKVFIEMMKIVDGASYYSIMIYSGDFNAECIDVRGSEEFAVKVYEDCKARAMKGPVDGKYLFISDEDREDALAEYRQCPGHKEG